MKTDTQLQHDVLAELKWEPSVNAADIGVEVNDGLVTLAGHVDSYAEKWHAEIATQRVSGVKALAVEIDVRLPGLSARTDADIGRTAENALKWMAPVPKDHVKAMVENGWITLTGEVDGHYQRTAAVAAMRPLMWVRGISSEITIKSAASATAVKADIEAALVRRARTDAHQVLVDVQGSDVTLEGTVHSWSERELAANSAWGTPGVHNVLNNIQVIS